jgi:hypothetical protein
VPALRLRFSETKSSTRARHLWQPIIPGKAAGRDPESRNRRLDASFRWHTGGECPSYSQFLKITLAAYSVFLAALLFSGGRPCTGGSNPGGNCGSGRANWMRVALPAFADVNASDGTVGSNCQFVNSI